MVNNDKEDVPAGVERRSQVPEYVSNADHPVRAEIAGIGMGRVETVNKRIALIVGLILEGFRAFAVRRHLIAKEGPDSGNPCLHRPDHVRVECPVVRREVNQAHRVRRACRNEPVELSMGRRTMKKWRWNAGVTTSGELSQNATVVAG